MFYHAKVYAGRAPRLKHLSAHIGRTGSGRSDVSVRSKELLTHSLAAKTGAGTDQRDFRTHRWKTRRPFESLPG